MRDVALYNNVLQMARDNVIFFKAVLCFVKMVITGATEQ